MKKQKSSHRTGFGFDSHLFDSKGTLSLGGKKFPGTPALKGHSDGDALLHALVDALLGAASLGDIGEMFPDSKAENKNRASKIFLSEALKRVKKAGYQTVHVDITVLAEKPRLAPVKAELRKILAALLKVPAKAVSVKAKTQEGLNLFKAPGGIAVWAVATLESIR